MPEESKKRIKPVIEEVVDASIEEETPVETKPQVEETKISETNLPVENTPVEIPANPVQPQTTPTPPSPKKGFKISLGFVAMVIIVALIVAVVSGALYVYFNGVSSTPQSPQATPEATMSTQATPTATLLPTPQASATPAPKLDTYKVSVLNGSGQIGAAGKAGDLLETAGFKIGNTGNAANFNYKTTTIQAKSTVPASVTKIAQDALAKEYEVSQAEAPLAASNTYDIVVIVGAN
jgi:hypothetical protein